MDEKIYDDIYFTLVSAPQGHPADVAAEIVASLATKHLLPVAQEYGVQVIGLNDETDEPQEIYLVAQDSEEAVRLAQSVNSKPGGSAQIAVRVVGMWHPILD